LNLILLQPSEMFRNMDEDNQRQGKETKNEKYWSLIDKLVKNQEDVLSLETKSSLIKLLN